jgi:aldehyde:ferredoxin oxidoreductase
VSNLAKEGNMFGWAGQILRLDLSNRMALKEPTEPYVQRFIGGRGIAMKIAYDEIDTTVSPFDPANKLFFCPGVLTGTPAPSTGRLKVFGLAPNGFLGAAGLGAYIPNQIKWAGYDLIVAEGKSDKPVYVYISNDIVEFKDASHLWGKDVYETQLLIKEKLGNSVHVMCIGPGGEKCIAFASVHTDWGSAAGMSGLGGIMGAKNLKAVAVAGAGAIRIARIEEFLKAAEEQRNWFKSNPKCSLEALIEMDKHLPSNFYKSELSPVGNWEPVDWDTLPVPTPEEEDKFYQQYSMARPIGCDGCPQYHFPQFDVPGVGRSSAKCTGRWSVTVSIRNDDLKLGFQVYNLANRYGLDVCSVTNITNFLTELYNKGIITEKDTDGIAMKPGDIKAVIAATHKIGKQEGFGKLFKDGVLAGARQIGRGAEEYAMHCKERELEPYSYRIVKQFALATAVDTRSNYVDAQASTLSYWIFAETEEDKKFYEDLAYERYGIKNTVLPTCYDRVAFATIDAECRHTAGDMIGICKWLIPWMGTYRLDSQVRLFSLATGVDKTETDLLLDAQRVITLERAFNVMRGMRRKDDTLPNRFFEEPVSSGRYKGERLPRAKFNKMLDEYYALLDYDEDGIPREEAFEKYGLSAEWELFKQRILTGKKA